MIPFSFQTLEIRIFRPLLKYKLLGNFAVSQNIKISDLFTRVRIFETLGD